MRSAPLQGAAIVLALGIGASSAAHADEAALIDEIHKLAGRIERLEQRNLELEKRLQAVQSTESRLEVLERTQADTEKALATERLSEKEPELVTRLKAVEIQSASVKKEAGKLEALDGISASASLAGVVQQVNAGGAEDGTRTSRANYRGDVTVTLPGGAWGDVEGSISTHLRFGQGNGVTLRPTYTSTPNSIAFQPAAGASDSYAIVAEAWYQLTAPLPFGGFKPDSHERLEFTIGKMDPFVFFDQNAQADDETTRYLNNAFVHNPLLDSGGDTAADAYGFAPGVRLAYASERGGSDTWGVSIAAFGSGPGADFSGSLAGPFVIGQVETTRRFGPSRTGTYRAYAWTNGRTVDFSGAYERHTGVGISAEQQVDDSVSLWGRLGVELRGQVRFDRALTLGAEIGGDRWGRAADAAGIAAGFLRTSGDYRDATADRSLAGYAASGTERIAELYYRWRVNDRFELTPDVQWIQRPGGNGSAPDVFVSGVRARVGF